MLPQRPETGSLARSILLAAAILAPALCLVALTWLVVLGAGRVQRQEAEVRIVAQVTGQAGSLQEQIRQQILTLNQTLRILADIWHADPAKFDLAAWRDRAEALSDVGRELVLTDSHGVIVQATLSNAVGIDISSRDYFVAAREHGGTEHAAYIGTATADRVLGTWHIPMSRGLRRADGSFGGALVVGWNISAVDELFNAAGPGQHVFIALVGLDDGRFRALVGPVTAALDESIAGSELLDQLRATPEGVWIGRSSPRDIVRLYVFRRIPGRNLGLVVGVDYATALTPFRIWQSQARLSAGCITALILVILGIALVGVAHARRREAALTFDRAMLASANAQLTAAKAQADAKTAQLEATLDGMSDGVAMIDAKLRLVQWNRHFSEIAGAPRHILRVGLPIEDVLRAQARGGQFGAVDVEAEVTRRMALLRAGAPIGTMERRRPDGHTIELRRDRLPDGGFVTLYADVTARKRSEDALRRELAIAEAATEAKSRFVAVVSHEIRTPLYALLTTLTLLHDGGLPPTQQALLDMARRSGEALLGLINDILEMSRMEAGQLLLRPSVFALRKLLEGVLEMFQSQAAERGIVLGLVTSPKLPRELYADPGRLRQVLINLASNAVKFGQPGAVDLLAGLEADAVGRPILHVAVRDRGPMIEPTGRARLFRPFSRLEHQAPNTDTPLSFGLGLAICRQIVSLMEGEIGCEPWISEDGHAGNEFWIRLPITPLPEHSLRQSSDEDLPVRRILPRTRILLVEDILANQLVTATLLRREGHLVDIVVDGEEALQAVARLPYDVVFMDIFMPGMSGFDVARQIRTIPSPANSMVIVALTANVSPDDQSLCREAGMKRLLSKPVVLSELVQAMAELTWRGLPRRSAATDMAAAPPPHSSVLSAERLGELRSSLPGDMLAGMVEECLIDLQGRLPVLSRAIQVGNADQAAAQAHAMVGMAAGYGMAALEARLRALMLAARSNDTARVAMLATELDAELSMTANALREALAIEIV